MWPRAIDDRANLRGRDCTVSGPSGRDCTAGRSDQAEGVDSKGSGTETPVTVIGTRRSSVTPSRPPFPLSTEETFDAQRRAGTRQKPVRLRLAASGSRDVAGQRGLDTLVADQGEPVLEGGSEPFSLNQRAVDRGLFQPGAGTLPREVGGGGQAVP